MVVTVWMAFVVLKKSYVHYKVNQRYNYIFSVHLIHVKWYKNGYIISRGERDCGMEK